MKASHGAGARDRRRADDPGDRSARVLPRHHEAGRDRPSAWARRLRRVRRAARCGRRTPGTLFNSGEYVREDLVHDARGHAGRARPSASRRPCRTAFPLRCRGGSPRRRRPASSPPSAARRLDPPRHSSPAPPASVASRPPDILAPPERSSGSMPAASDLARKKSILDRAKWIDQEDYFKMLMVSREADDRGRSAPPSCAQRRSGIRTRSRLSIIEVRLECENVFARITTAYETLVAPEKRRAYERSIDDEASRKAPRPITSSPQAEMHITLGDRERPRRSSRKALVAAPGFPEAMRAPRAPRGDSTRAEAAGRAPAQLPEDGRHGHRRRTRCAGARTTTAPS